MTNLSKLESIISETWGFSSLRPLQIEAMEADLEGRDSLVVLPTGGGKSLCYQAPALMSGRLTAVISPLISLMKDQVDSLREVGVAALQLDSMQSVEERRQARRAIMNREVSLLYVSPTRLLSPTFQELIARADVRSFAIDEAHCISHWGHDFWPEYRQLQMIKRIYPEAAVHAFTATATERVRDDIVEQLGMRDPIMLVGAFDRPNLTYRIAPRHDTMHQVMEILERHRGEAGIIYCIRRRDVDELTTVLTRQGC